jgi:hypothetical protein
LKAALDHCAGKHPRDAATLAPLYTATHVRKHLVPASPAASNATAANPPSSPPPPKPQDNSAFSIRRSSGKGPSLFGWQVRGPSLAMLGQEAMRSLSLSGVPFGGAPGGGQQQPARSAGFRLPSRGR